MRLLLIEPAHRESRQTYGSPRITHWLRDHGQPCGRVRVARLRRQAGINRRPRRRFRPMSLTNSDHDLPVSPNRLLAQAQPTRPDAVWVADITYVETQEGFLYVAGILDRCRRWRHWTWRSRTAALMAAGSIIPTKVSNRPAEITGNDWPRPEPCRV